MQDAREITTRYQYLLSACSLINSTLDLDTLLDTITGQAMEIINAEASSLLMLDNTGKNLIFKVAHGDVAHMLKNERLPLGEGVAGWVAEKGEPLLIADASKDSRFSHGIDKKTGFTTRTLVCVPLKTVNGVLGVLEVVNRKGDAFFDESHVEFLMAMANQAAIAIENALLYQQLKAEKNKIESIVNSMSDGVIVMDHHSEISMMNPAARRIFDLTKGKGEGSKVSQEKLQFILREVKSLTEDALFDIVMMKPENIILSNNVTLFKGAEGSNSGAVMVLRNITQNKEREVMRSEFLTLLAYKSFAPLESLVREIDMLAHDTSGDTPLRDIYEIQKNMHMLKNYIQKLYYFSELEAGPLRLERGSCNIRDLVEESIAFSKDELINLTVDADLPDIEGSVMVDGGKIMEAVMLLVYFCSTTIIGEGETLRLKLTEKDDLYLLKVVNPIPATLLESMHRICACSNIVEEFCRLHGGSEGMDLLEFAFIRHLLDAHGGSLLLEKQDNNDVIILSIPRDKGECVAYGQQADEAV
jgi:signal transduction histidine kinase